jgi:hypothetical protein
MRKGKGGKKKIEEDMKMMHEELNLKLKNLRNLRKMIYLKKLKEKIEELQEIEKKRVKCWRITFANEVFSNVHSWRLACNLLSLEKSYM